MWQMVEENLKTHVCRAHGEYTSLKKGLQYAPEVLDAYFTDYGIGTDEKDRLIGDFMQCGGKVAVVSNGRQFFLTKKMFNAASERTCTPAGCIRVGGKAVWKVKGKILGLVVVTHILSPDSISVTPLETPGMSFAVRHDELEAA